MFKNLKVKNLKAGEIWTRRGVTIYRCGGSYVGGFYGFWTKCPTLKELKEEIKTALNS